MPVFKFIRSILIRSVTRAWSGPSAHIPQITYDLDPSEPKPPAQARILSSGLVDGTARSELRHRNSMYVNPYLLQDQSSGKHNNSINYT